MSRSIMLLTGAALFETIQQTIGGSRALCAVAFWGSGAEQLFLGPPDRDLRVICNLAMGGTNPHVILRLLEAGIDVRQCDALHAKVYIGTDDAVITSANASMNGLGLGAEAGWIETGCIIPAEAAVPWFEGLWDQSNAIEVPEDINAALVRFIREAKIRKDNIALGVVTPGSEQEEDLSEVYHGVSVTQAISLVLSVYQRPMTVPEIAAELEAGGLRTAAERFTDSISNAIGRGIVRGIFGRAGHARWGLMEWPGVVAAERSKVKAKSQRKQDIKPRDPTLSVRTLAGLAAARQRGVIGGSQGKLTAKDRAEILSAIAAGERQSAIARRFGVTQAAINKVSKRPTSN